MVISLASGSRWIFFAIFIEVSGGPKCDKKKVFFLCETESEIISKFVK